MSEKLQKVLAGVGLGSRRGMETLISEGRVSVNGKIAELGARVEDRDEIRVDGRKVHFSLNEELKRRIIAYYKPEGEICSKNDPEGRPTVFDRLPPINKSRWIMVGRLDINSTGLLIFTNDGELANKLMHPSTEVERQYAVRVMGEVTPEIIKKLTTGVELEDGPARFESFHDLGGEGINRWYQVVVKEGRNREVRRLFESQGLRVSRLLRTRYGNMELPRDLRTGKWTELTKDEVKTVETFVKNQIKTVRKNSQNSVEDVEPEIKKTEKFWQKNDRPKKPTEARSNDYKGMKNAEKRKPNSFQKNKATPQGSYKK